MTLNDVFKNDGLLNKKFPNYEIRTGQVQMAFLVQQALTENKSALIEGATGIGKGFAYLIPTIMLHESIIVSTSNKSLQDQLDKKDLPALQTILNTSFQWTVLKGKNNYFCHEHFEINRDEIKTELLRDKELDFQDADLIIQDIAKWAEKETIGDLEYCPIELTSKVKTLIGCDNQTKHEKDSEGSKFCFATRARARAQESQIVLVNHSLLAVDIALRDESDGKAKILPDTQAVIIDEAHEFEKAAILAFSDEISLFSLLHLLNWTLVRKYLPKRQYIALCKALQSVLTNYLPEKGQTYYTQRKVEKFEGLEPVIEGINSVISVLGEIKKTDEQTQQKIREITKEAEKLQERLASISEANESMLRWSEARDGRTNEPIITLHSVPLDISEMLKEGLFKNKTVICTSATLAIHNSFEFFEEQVGMPKDALKLIVPSPFNYKEQALIYISDGQFDKPWEIQELLRMSKGRAFVLFTSYKDMRDCFQQVTTDHPKFMQGEEGQTRAQLLDKFKETPNAILFGTKSFWEGVDIKGEKLSLVIIHKIPFENPKDLVFSSKCEKIDEKYGRGKSFIKYAIPDACLKLKQGAGRLIRSTTDTGVIALLDARVNYASYGERIITSLPPAYRTQKLEKVEKFFERINA